MSSKSKSSASEASNNKPSSPATPKVSRLSSRVGTVKSDADYPSPLQKARVSVDQSPKSVTSKPISDRRTPKPNTTPDKQPTRGVKGSELQAQLNTAQEDLKKAKEKLASSEKEKARASEEAKEAKKLADEANGKLQEALLAQKRAEEDSEIERFRSLEIEQVGIETTQKKDEEWQKELESVRNQHAIDLNALLSTTEELQRVKQDLAMSIDTKNQALTHADDATKIAEIHAEKMELLSAELARVKASMDSKLDKEANEKNELISNLNSEVNSLKLELEKVKIYEEKLVKKEDLIEQTNVELEAAKMAESYARNLADEWMKKAEDIEIGLEKANQLEKSASESLELVEKKLEESESLLKRAESEISSLNEKVEFLEMSVSRQRGDIEESEHLLDVAKGEAAEMAKRIEFLVSKLEIEKEKNIQAMDNEKVASESFNMLLEEKNKLVKELENLSEENEKNKEAMESLTAALHEVSAEARETKEKFLSIKLDNENYELEMENMRFALQSTTEKYEVVVADAKKEIDSLSKSLELSKKEYQSSKEEWEKKEIHFIGCVKQSDEERSSMEREISRLTTLMKENEEKFCVMEEKRASMANILKEAENEATHLKEALGEAKGESMRSTENLLDKENEIQSLVHENEELRKRENASLKKIEELSKLLEESIVNKQNDENGEISDSEKDYDMLPKVVEFSEQNGDDNSLGDEVQSGSTRFGNLNGKYEDKKSKEKYDDSIEVDSKMWASCKIEDNEFSIDKSIEQESFEKGVDSKIETGESYDHINGLSSSETHENGETSPLEQQSQKKKKPLLKKFGSLLKKKGTNNQK